MAMHKFMTNVQMLSDAYKYSHPRIYNPGTTSIKSYFESRGGKWAETTFFGLQYYLKNYYTDKVVTKSLVQSSKRDMWEFFGRVNFDKKEFERRWMYIVDKYNGHLPLRIRSVLEGTTVPTKNVLMTIQETDDNCWWLTNFVESTLVQTWYGSTVATQSRSMKMTILEYLHKTGTPELVDYLLVDFGLRGVSSIETAGVGGAAHLINFKATDNIPGYWHAREFYKAKKDVGTSIPASEHSTITSWKKENELKAMANMLDQFPSGMIACVSDSFDIYRACREYWGTALKDRILERDGVLVIRPDSGDPLEVLPKLLEILGEKFGFTVNAKGYKVLHPKVRLIQGDGIDHDSLREILECITGHGWSADNLAFGSGGGLLQKVNRDTSKYAFKCSQAIINGEEIDVYKDPITDPGKSSKRGVLKLIIENGQFKTVRMEDPGDDQLVTVFENGKLLIDQNFDDIRNRASIAV